MFGKGKSLTASHLSAYILVLVSGWKRKRPISSSISDLSTGDHPGGRMRPIYYTTSLGRSLPACSEPGVGSPAAFKTGKHISSLSRLVLRAQRQYSTRILSGPGLFTSRLPQIMGGWIASHNIHFGKPSETTALELSSTSSSQMTPR